MFSEYNDCIMFLKRFLNLKYDEEKYGLPC